MFKIFYNKDKIYLEIKDFNVISNKKLINDLLIFINL